MDKGKLAKIERSLVFESHSLLAHFHFSGCNCPYGYGGPHCEYLGDASLMASAADYANAGDGGGRGNVAFNAAIVVVVVVLVVIGSVLGHRVYKRRQQAAREQMVERTHLNTSGPFENGKNNNSNNANGNNNSLLIDLGPQRDFDGNELEEVEIL